MVVRIEGSAYAFSELARLADNMYDVQGQGLANTRVQRRAHLVLCGLQQRADAFVRHVIGVVL